ncbi:MAG: hypothetical protein ABI442_03700 [Gemmatimonadaceae bacterium]
MYSTCLHCHHKLDRNDSIEAFQIGSKLAFDSEKGRLWAICGSCARWNLKPIEERWEAVEQCEKLFRALKLRAQTDNIGRAKLRDGTELIRIGKPLRPEFAAWRYGREFSRRFRRRAVYIGGATAAVAGGILGLSAAGIIDSSLLVLPVFCTSVVLIGAKIKGERFETFLPVRAAGDHGKSLIINAENLEHTQLSVNHDATLRLRLQHYSGREEFVGDRAARVLSSVLRGINGSGAGAGTIEKASSFIADAKTPGLAIARISAEARAREGDYSAEYASYARGDWMNPKIKGAYSSGTPPINRGALHRLPALQRLALEMALHEHSEQHALDDDLASLERDWREAEEIAAIADDLLTPKSVNDALAAAKRKK